MLDSETEHELVTQALDGNEVALERLGRSVELREPEK